MLDELNKLLVKFDLLLLSEIGTFSISAILPVFN